MWLSCWGAGFEIRSSRVQVPLRTNLAKIMKAIISNSPTRARELAENTLATVNFSS